MLNHFYGPLKPHSWRIPGQIGPDSSTRIHRLMKFGRFYLSRTLSSRLSDCHARIIHIYIYLSRSVIEISSSVKVECTQVLRDSSVRTAEQIVLFFYTHGAHTPFLFTNFFPLSSSQRSSHLLKWLNTRGIGRVYAVLIKVPALFFAAIFKNNTRLYAPLVDAILCVFWWSTANRSTAQSLNTSEYRTD